MAKILLIDDNSQIRRGVEKYLTKGGHESVACANGREALEELSVSNFDLILTDLRMPVMSGLEFLNALKKEGHDVPVIVITGHASVDSAVEAMKLGAADYLTKPVQFPELSIRIERLLERKKLENENKRLRNELKGKFSFGGIIGNSGTMKTVFDRLKPLAADRDISVLIYGETGTGKELAARGIHYNGPRAEKPFVAINCGALPEHLLESELFGHEKGAFTDAREQKIGLFEAANGGTLFLDELDSMPLGVQVKLLRAIEEREIRRVGGTAQISLDVRFLAASCRSLESLVESNEFRADLYFRIAVASVEVPPLRDRAGDVMLLINHFLQSKVQADAARISFSAEALRLLDQYQWPGNVRELENMVELFSVTHTGRQVEATDLNLRDFDEAPNTSSSFNGTDDLKSASKKISETFERELILNKLNAHRWNITRAAIELGISRAALHSKIKQFNLRDG